MHKLAVAAACFCCACAIAPAQADDQFRAGLTLSAGFGGRTDQSSAPHLLASFGSSPQFLQQNRSAASQCLMTAGDLRINGAVNAASSCTDAPLLQFDLNDNGLRAANLFGLNLMKAPSLIDGYRRDVLTGNSEWVQWTLRQHQILNDYYPAIQAPVVTPVAPAAAKPRSALSGVN